MPHTVEACYGSPLHCHWHEEDEPLAGFRYCLECGHMFVTADDLLEAHNEILAQLNAETCTCPPDVIAGETHLLWCRGDAPPMPLETDPGQVHSCPMCSHDF